MDNFIISLVIMGKGMAGIFAALLLIMLAVWMMGKLAGKGQEEEKQG